MKVHKLIYFFKLIITWQNLPKLGTNILGERDLVLYSDKYLSQCKKRQLSKKGKYRYIANLKKKMFFRTMEPFSTNPCNEGF